MSNISRSKGNHTMKFGNLIKYNKRNIFLQITCREWGRETSSRSLFKKVLHEVKASGLQLSFNIFRWPSTLAYNKNKLYKTSNYRYRDMLNFDFLEKGLVIVSPQHFVYDFTRKIFVVLNSINCAIVCKKGCDIINFEINLVFLIKPFFYITKKSRKKFKYVENERAFRRNKMHFSSFLRGSQLPKVVSDLRVRL